MRALEQGSLFVLIATSYKDKMANAECESRPGDLSIYLFLCKIQIHSNQCAEDNGIEEQWVALVSAPPSLKVCAKCVALIFRNYSMFRMKKRTGCWVQEKTRTTYVGAL